MYISADTLAGFRESFNVEKFCRFCLANPVDIQQCSVRSGLFTLRTPELFDEAVNVLKQTGVSCVDGVKADCPLNRLAHFHAAKGICLCLSSLISKGHFTLNDLNCGITTLPF